MKHNSYKNPAIITVRRQGEKYLLSYESEEWELYAKLDEIVGEIKEHLELMEGE